MSNSKTPKIVVGVALAAAYAGGLAYFTLGRPHDEVIVQNTSAAQPVADAVPPTDSFPTPADSPASVPEQPPAVPATFQPPAAGVAEKTPAASPASGESVATTLRSKAQTFASVTNTSPAEKADAEKSDSTSEGTSTVSESVSATGDAPSTAQAVSAPAGNDSQITADVKSQIAAVAPASTIDVTTTDGVVELTGSVPSEEFIDKARLAARNVAAVRDVDVSALTISN